MPDDKRKVLELAERGRRKKRGDSKRLWEQIQSIHAHPALREFVTLESLPLRPCVLRTGKGTEVFLLLARAAGDALTPWGCLSWRWPSMQVTGMVDVRHILRERTGLPRELVCTSREADLAQAALESGAALPALPEPLPVLYRAVLASLGRAEDFDAQTASAAGGQEPATEPPAAAPQPPADAARPAPLPPVPGFLARSRELLRQSGDEKLLGPELTRIESELRLTGFTVAVVGEFSRGKSTLINSLLEFELLPVGDLPTTAMLCRVRYAPENGLWRVHPDRRVERLSADPGSWADLVADSSGNDPAGVVQVDCSHPWLKQSGIQIFDTPGAGDLNGPRAERAYEAIASCDATLVAVSATMALSLTERAFLEEHVLSKRVPRVAVVLTRLDQVEASEHRKLLDYVSEKLREWAPGARVWTALPRSALGPGAEAEVAGPEEIRAALLAWSRDPAHFGLKALRAVGQLEQVAQTARKSLGLRITQARASAEEQRKAVRCAEDDLNRRRLEWEDLRLSMDQRESQTAEWLEKTLRGLQAPVFDSLRLDLGRVPNPKDWWEKELPFRLHRELLVAARGINEGLAARLGQDALWLRAQAQQRFGWELEVVRPEDALPASALEGLKRGAPDHSGLDDIGRLQWIARIGSGTLTVVGFLVPPIRLVSVAGAVIGGLWAEKHLKGRADEQRQAAAPVLADAVDRALSECIGSARDRVGAYYQRLLSETRRQEELWHSVRQQALRQSAEKQNPDVTSWQSALETAERLSADLSVWTRGAQR